MPLRKRPGLVLHRGLDQDAVHFGRLGDLERLEDDLVLRLVPERVGHFDRDLAALERIVVDPLGRVGRALRDCAEQLRIDVEADLPWQDVLWMLDLRDDPHRSGQAGAAERRRDANAERGLLARDRARGSAEREKRGDATSFQLPASSCQLKSAVANSAPASSFQLRFQLADASEYCTKTCLSGLFRSRCQLERSPSLCEHPCSKPPIRAGSWKLAAGSCHA